MTPERLGLPAARRLALAAAGFARARPGADPVRGVARGGLLQIDSVSTVVRAHYLPLFSRLGPYDRTALDRAAWGGKPRRLFEYWAHEASLLPVALQPLLRWRMARAAAGQGIYTRLAAFRREQGSAIDGVLQAIRDRGGLAASDLEGARGSGGWWGWSDGKRALEWLFWAGLVTTATRRGSFERVYDLPERVLPAAVLAIPTPSPADAHRALLRIAAGALGIATAGDLRDYFRMSPADALPRIAELVEEGELIPTTVEGWTQPAFRHRDARLPRRVDVQALLAPFDPVVWHRPRTERLFGLRFRLEIYTPAARRLHGYYVLPFLLGDTIVARVDLKSDRAAATLRVLAAHGEPGAPAHTAAALANELRLMAGWLGLEQVAVGGAGDLAPALAAAVEGS